MYRPRNDDKVDEPEETDGVARGPYQECAHGHVDRDEHVFERRIAARSIPDPRGQFQHHHVEGIDEHHRNAIGNQGDLGNQMIRSHAMEANGTQARDPGLSWSQLRAFEASASVLSFSAAALRLSITASAVRYQIALLESRLGTRLFERRGGRLALTPVGASFQRRKATYARAIEGLRRHNPIGKDRRDCVDGAPNVRARVFVSGPLSEMVRLQRDQA